MELACAYIRYSSNKQEGNNSVEVQRSEIMNAASKNDHHLPNQLIFIDRKTSAYHKKATQRSGLLELKKTVKTNREIQFIYFYDYSRVDRTVYSFVEEFYYDLKQYRPDIQIFICTTGSTFDPEDPRTKLEFILANYESAKKARNITDTQIRLIENNERPGARSPYGYRMQFKKLYPNEDAPNVLWIFFLYSNGISMPKIARILNTDKVKPPQGVKWRANTVREILQNKRYTGKLAWTFERRIIRKYEFTDVHEPIVPEFLYRLVEMNKKMKERMERFDTKFLLSNLVRCSLCHSPLATKNSSTKRNGKAYDYRYYQCKSCEYSLEVENLHEFVINDISNFLKNDLSSIFQNVMTYFQEFKSIVNKELKVKQEDLLQIKNNHNYIQDNSIDFPTEIEQIVQNAICSMEEKIKLLQYDLRNIQCFENQNELSFFFSNFSNLEFLKLTDSELRFIFALFIDTISISSNGSYNIVFKNNPFEWIVDR